MSGSVLLYAAFAVPLLIALIGFTAPVAHATSLQGECRRGNCEDYELLNVNFG